MHWNWSKGITLRSSISHAQTFRWRSLIHPTPNPRARTKVWRPITILRPKAARSKTRRGPMRTPKTPSAKSQGTWRFTHPKSRLSSFNPVDQECSSAAVAASARLNARNASIWNNAPRSSGGPSPVPGTTTGIKFDPVASRMGIA